MIGITLSYRCTQECSQRIYLNQGQKLLLSQLLGLRQELKHPEFPYAAKGFEGMQEAHKILKEKQVPGVLIGGLAEAIWNKRRTKEELSQHKDVDVLVLDSVDLDKFEGGIDWWTKREGRLKITTNFGYMDNVESAWYKNDNDILLSFGVRRAYDNLYLPPGLYLPCPDWVIDMRKKEAVANIDFDGLHIEYDDNVSKRFEEDLKKRIKTRLPKFIQEGFKDYILDFRYPLIEEFIHAGPTGVPTKQIINLQEFSIEKLRAINSLEGKVEETLK